ncbi:hypothetical protein N7456_003942 [Penicillium angulare]|uniref:Helicase ATP-binding domain-containing protein n=1 Tax=Penicillium angulare TaxID=116970 RepID=A0A9W9KJ74_9EURO|nr:hypothetical protein N7456_003942 [Penicillium angulare]
MDPYSDPTINETRVQDSVRHDTQKEASTEIPNAPVEHLTQNEMTLLNELVIKTNTNEAIVSYLSSINGPPQQPLLDNTNAALRSEVAIADPLDSPSIPLENTSEHSGTTHRKIHSNITATVDLVEGSPSSFPSNSDELFCDAVSDRTEDDEGIDGLRVRTVKTPKSKKRNFLTVKDRERSRDIGLSRVLAVIKGVPSKKIKNRIKKDICIVVGEAAKTLGDGIERFFSNNLAESAARAAALPAMPAFSSTQRSFSLKEIVDNIPSSEDKAQARNDIKELEQAIKAFNIQPRIHKREEQGDDVWTHKGSKSRLMTHQLLAVGFMIRREEPNKHPRGGFFYHAVGLGKTLCAIGLILNEQAVPWISVHDPVLIVAPSHLTSLWLQEIDKHCEPDAIGSVTRYRADSQIETKMVINSLLSHNVVVASYEDVRRSYPSPVPPPELGNSEERLTRWWEIRWQNGRLALHHIKWHRIILDEAHAIKNPDTYTSIAVRALAGNSKWILSGTPLHNTVMELYSYFNLLDAPRSESLASFEEFYRPRDTKNKRLINMLRGIVHPMNHDSTILGHRVVNLPDLSAREVVIEFYDAEKIIYDAIVDAYVEQINDLGEAGQVLKQRRCILAMLNYTRMFASHPLTSQVAMQNQMREDVLNKLRSSCQGVADPSDRSTKITQSILLVERKVHIPTAALEEPDKFALEQNRAHSEKLILDFYALVSARTKRKRFSTGGFGTSKRAKRTIMVENQRYLPELNVDSDSDKSKEDGYEDESECSTEEDVEEDWMSVLGSTMPGSKVDKARKIITDWIKEDPTVKVVIFTEWINTIRLLELMCAKEKWSSITLTGKLSMPKRDNAIRIYNEDPEMKIMLATQKTGGTGINLTAGNKCIMMDPWWNNAAQGRLYRKGQERPVENIMLIAKNTTDERMTEIQQRKQKEIKRFMSLEALNDRATTQELLEVFGVVEQHNGIFKIHRPPRD